ncbi:spondin-2 [Phlebotomus papatasi]|nr:spondin-2 [Phlebotomus papatasi]
MKQNLGAFVLGLWLMWGRLVGGQTTVAASVNPTTCHTGDRLAVYRVVLHTYWTRDLFPKHFPDWRPPAQWTITIGRTHTPHWRLFREGELASAGVKQFVETGRSDLLTDGLEESVFDAFTLPAIGSGSGRSEGKFFVDANHSAVSLITRIVPSPDWFIGIDSFSLCSGDTWIDSVTVEMNPMDAGTDNGFTFTAPNWPTEPQGVIYRITARYPAHPAGSFFYPQSPRLPPIGTFQFIKLKEYELSEVFNHEEDDRKYETVAVAKTHLNSEKNHVEMNNELSANIERERQYEVSPLPSIFTERDRIRAKLLAKLNPNNNSTSSNTSSTVIPKNDKKALLSNIIDSYATTVPSRSSRNRRIKVRPRRDCRVSHWSDWSACSKSCGIGEMHRRRRVLKPTRRGGRPCPPLQESKWCGSARDCTTQDDYFKW